MARPTPSPLTAPIISRCTVRMGWSAPREAAVDASELAHGFVRLAIPSRGKRSPLVGERGHGVRELRGRHRAILRDGYPSDIAHEVRCATLLVLGLEG